MNSIFVQIWGILVLITSFLMFFLSTDILISSFYLIISIICGLFLIFYQKNIPLFSPAFMLLSSFFINISLPALYFFQSKNEFPQNFLTGVSIIYLIYFLTAVIPLLVVKKSYLPELKNNFFSKSFESKNISSYLAYTNILMVLIIILLLKFSGFSYIEALKNPLEFRYTVSAGGIAFFRKVLILLLMINTFLLSRINFSNNNFKFHQKNKLFLFSVIHIFILLTFGIISGSRSVFFLPVVSSIIIYTFYNRVKIKQLVVLSIIFIFLAAGTGFYSVYRMTAQNPAHFENISTREILEKVHISQEIMNRLDNFKNSVHFFDFINRKHNTLLFFSDFQLLNQAKNHLLQPLPRNIAKEKGYFFSTEATSKVLNIPPADLKVTYNYGGISNAFWNLGLAGIILEALFLGVLVVWMHKNFQYLISNDTSFIFYMATIFYIPNSIIVDGFLNTMDSWNYIMNIFISFITVLFLTNSARSNITEH